MERCRGQGMFSVRGNCWGAPQPRATQEFSLWVDVVFKETWIQRVVFEVSWSERQCCFRCWWPGSGGRLLLGDQILAMFESVMEVAMHLVMHLLVGSLRVPSFSGMNRPHVMAEVIC